MPPPHTTFLEVLDLLNEHWKQPEALFPDQDKAPEGLLAWSDVLTSLGTVMDKETGELVETHNYGGMLGCQRPEDRDRCLPGCPGVQASWRCLAVYSTPAEGIAAWKTYVEGHPAIVAALNGASTRRLAYELLMAGLLGEEGKKHFSAADLSEIETELDKSIDRLVVELKSANPDHPLKNLWTDKTWKEPGVGTGPSAAAGAPPPPSGMSTAGKLALAAGAALGLGLLWKASTRG